MQTKDGIKAGVVVVTDFIDKRFPNKKHKGTYKSYIDYIDRDEATRNQTYSNYSLYNDYMGNPKKSSGLFTAEKNNLNKDEISELKKSFQTAYDNDSIMWQTVISFDNRFLAKYNIYDPTTKTLNEARLMECTRNMMGAMLQGENMTASAIWSAAIHYNTDNIHVHIATVEPFPTRPKKEYRGEMRPRGCIKQTTRKAMKSKVVNTILAPDRQLVDELTRNRMILGKEKSNSFDDPELKRKFINIYRQLPKDKRLWKYGMNGIAHLRPEIDNFTMTYINKYHREDYDLLRKTLLKQEKVMIEAYGLKSHAHEYMNNQLDDLFKRMGNKLLDEMREFAKVEITPPKTTHAYFRNNGNAANLDYALRRVHYNLGAQFKQFKINQREHELLTRDLEM